MCEETTDFVRCPGNSPFCLGMTDFNCCDVESDRDAQPEPKRSKLSLAKKKPLSPMTRFNTTVTEEEIEKSSKGCIPAITAKSTNWAVRTLISAVAKATKRTHITRSISYGYITETLCY